MDFIVFSAVVSRLNAPMDVRAADRGRCIPMDWYQHEVFRLVLSPNKLFSESILKKGFCYWVFDNITIRLSLEVLLTSELNLKNTLQKRRRTNEVMHPKTNLNKERHVNRRKIKRDDY